MNNRIGPATAAIRLLALAVLLFLVAAWVVTLTTAAQDPSVLYRDWVAFHRAGQLLLDGQTQNIYAPSFETRYPFLYPPYAIYLFAPLGLLPPTGAYAVCVLAACAALAAGVCVIRSLLPAPRGEYVTVALVVFASGPFVSLVVTGQISALYVLLIVSGFFLWDRRRPMTAGMVLSLLAIKPNLVALFVVIMLCRRQWRVLAGMVLGGAILAASTLPLGLGVWRDWQEAATRMAALLRDGGLPVWKHQTLYAFWRTALGEVVDPRLVTAVWGLSVATLLLAAGFVWRSRYDASQRARQLGVTVLLIVACNPYLYFYDGLLLAIPGIVWYVRRDQYTSPRCHRICGVSLAVIYVWQHLSLWLVQESWAFVGAVVAVWLLTEAYDLVLATERSPLPVPATDRAEKPHILSNV